MSRKSTVDEYADALAQAMPPLTPRHLDLVLAAYRAVLAGKPAEIARVTPASAGGEEVHVSFLIPSGPFTSDVRLPFCDYVLFFDGRHSAERWTSEHPGTTALPLEEAAAIGRALALRLRQDASSEAA